MFTGAFSSGKQHQTDAANRHHRRAPPHRAPRENTKAGWGLISRDEFEALIGGRVALITFNALWCTPCRKQEQVVDELFNAHGGKVTVAKINVDQNQLMAMELGIQSIPTTIFFKGGREVDRYIGFQTLETLDRALRDVLASTC